MFPATSVDEILSRLKAVETRVSAEETCIIGGSTFTSLSSVGEYDTTHAAVSSCGMFWDLFSVLVRMSDQGHWQRQIR